MLRRHVADFSVKLNLEVFRSESDLKMTPRGIDRLANILVKIARFSKGND